MKIETVESWRETVPLSRPYSIANHSFDAVALFFLRLRADDGSIGLGSASPAEFVTGESEAACEAALAPEALGDLVGRDPRWPTELVRAIGEARAATPAARAAIDMALWDLHGRAAGKPVVDLLGRRYQSLPTSVTLGISSVEKTLSEAQEWVGRGFDHLKIKLGDDLEIDLERLARLRERFGQAVRLRVDANQGYGPEEVKRLFASATPLDLELIEQPLARGEDERLGALTPPPRVPLAADESLHDARDALVQAEEASPYRIFNIKLMKCGGIGPARAISAVADTAGRDLMWGCMDESRISIAAALHVAYACPRTKYLDLDGSLDLARDPAVGGFEVREGKLVLTGEAGLGVWLGDGYGG